MTAADPRRGAKPRDYPWTVLAVDPVAFPLTGYLARTRRLTPDGVTWVSFGLGVLSGPAYALGAWPGLVLGGLLFYLSFVADCVDGKLARMLQAGSEKGKMLEDAADGARRLSASLGLIAYLWRSDGGPAAIGAAISFALAMSYFTQIWGGGGSGRATGEPRGRIDRALARHRLLPTLGVPDVSAIVFVLGPMTNLVVPALVVGLVLVLGAIARVLVRLAKG
ncbi:hypothetical protein BH18ACT15_BH18ACT15_03290 [soil metagenome]